MRRREFIASGVGLTTVLAGCLNNPLGGGGGSNPTETQSPTETQTQTQTETATSTATETNSLPTEEDVPTAAAKFTPSGSTPLAKSKFIDTFGTIIDGKSIMTAYYINVLPDGVVEVTYVADEENQQKRMTAFVEAYLTLSKRVGGTNRNMTGIVQKTGGKQWYTWELTHDLAISYLTGEISKKKLMKKVRATVKQQG